VPCRKQACSPCCSDRINVSCAQLSAAMMNAPQRLFGGCIRNTSPSAKTTSTLIHEMTIGVARTFVCLAHSLPTCTREDCRYMLVQGCTAAMHHISLCAACSCRTIFIMTGVPCPACMQTMTEEKLSMHIGQVWQAVQGWCPEEHQGCWA